MTTAQFLTSVQQGTRQSPEVTASSGTAQTGSSVAPENYSVSDVPDLLKSVTPGKRRYTVTPYPASTAPKRYKYTGGALTGQYQILDIVSGRRLPAFHDGNTTVPFLTPAVVPLKTKAGISTVGIAYQPAEVVQQTSKLIRRWPREWHGENMN